MLISRPQLAAVLAAQGEGREMRAEFFSRLCAAVDREEAVAAKTDALRRAWYRIVIGIGCRDMAAGSEEGHAGFLDSDSDESSNPLRPAPPTSDRLPPADLKESNLDQTALAEAALRVAAEIALGSIGVSGVSAEQLPFAILGLGRLGHSGMDYGSDLDLLVVFDDESRWPPPALDAIAPRGSAQEFYAKLTAQLVRVLSSITREGLLYRMDLRLRPDGQSGPLAQGISGLVAYLTERASAWEHSAYLKVREVAGDLTFGARAREAICEAVFTSAARNLSLKEELRSMRARLEKEKARRGRPNIKWGAGGMTDVYFITRYLQLRDRISFPTERGTTALITHLGERGSLDPASTEAIYEGYSFLRKLDHWMRLLLDRPGPALPDTQIGLRDITRAMGIASVEQIEQLYAAHTARIREVYNLVFE
jgi:glutamate-ammonia-ligase adenylyltransferase